MRPVTGIDNLFLITGSPALASMDHLLRNVRQPERRLADALRPLERQFDAIVLDAPAGFGIMSLSVPFAAQHLIVPIRAEYLGLESLAQFLRWYRDRRHARRATASVAGILLTMVDYRRQATREIVDIIRTHNRKGVLRTEIPLDPRAAEAPSHGIPVVSVRPLTRGRRLRAVDDRTAAAHRSTIRVVRQQRSSGNLSCGACRVCLTMNRIRSSATY